MSETGKTAASGSSSPPPPAADAVALRPFYPALAFGFFNAVNWQVALGTPMVLLVEALGGSTFQVGLCYAFVFLMAPIQVFATALLPKYGFKRMMMSGWGLRALFLLPCIVIAAFGKHGHTAPWMIYAMIGSVFCFVFFRSLGSCAWMPWMYKLLPEQLRGRYFASEQVTSGIASVGILLLCSILFKVLSPYDAFIVEYSVAFVGAALSWFALRKMHDTERPTTISLARVVDETPGICLKPGDFRRFLWVSCWYGFVTTAISPFGIYFLKVELHVLPGDILTYSTAQYCGVILMSLLLRGEIDRRGPRPFFFAAGLGYAALALFWIALLVFRFDARSYFPLVYLWLGMVSALWVSANLNYLPSVVPPDNRPLVLAVQGAATAFISGLAPVVWGLLLKEEGPTPAMNRTAFIVFFVFVLLSMAGIVAWMRRFRYPTGKTEKLEFGDLVLRPHRAFSYLITLVDTSITPPRTAESAAKDEPAGPGKD